jgi:hypothetical protein
MKRWQVRSSGSARFRKMEFHLKYKNAILLALAILFINSQANALMFGIRFSDLTQQTLPGVSDAGAKGRFGAFFGTKEKNNVILFGADYDRISLTRGDSSFYSRRLTVDIGYRYLLFGSDKSDAMKIAPFIGIQYFKSFSQVEADSGVMGLTPAQVKYIKDLANDSGILVSAGAEYYFSPVFSFGAEGGIRYSKASSSALGYKVKFGEYNSYVAMLLSFYLQ